MVETEEFPTFREFMERKREGTDRILVQAIANLTVNVYPTMTPEEIYEMLKSVAIQVREDYGG